MPSTPLRFPNARGQELAARLDLPDAEPQAYALFAHCFTCSKDSKAAAFIAQALAKRGIAVLRFDFTGLGMSTGEFADTTFSSNLADLLAAFQFLKARYQAPALVVGHSLGGAAVLAAAGDMAEARAVATIGAPFEAAHVSRLFPQEDIVEKGEALVDIGGRPFHVRREFLEDLRRHDPAARIGALRKALLVLHSPQDQTVGIEQAGKIFLAAKHPKSFVSLDGADHLLANAQDAAYAADLIAAWSSRYLDR
jgi:alpha-beta hydrolase superfamily lysophospholipase